MKYFLINNIYIYISISITFANSFNQWVESNEVFFLEDIKKIKFQLHQINDIYKQYDCSLVICDEKKFRLEIGPRIIISDGNSWKSYDNRNNQILIQEPDRKIERILFSWINKNKIKLLPISKISNHIYKINLLGEKNDVQLYISDVKLDSIILVQNTRKYIKLSNIDLMKADSINLSVGNKSSTTFDFR